MGDVIIRDYLPKDSEKIAKIESQIFSCPWSKNAVDEFVQNESGHAIVCCKNDEVVGYVTFSTVLDEIQIANVAVDPSHRRCGIARKILTFLHSYARDNGFSVIYLEVRVSNMPAIKLYEGFGYKNAGVRRNFYSSPREDGYIFILTL